MKMWVFDKNLVQNIFINKWVTIFCKLKFTTKFCKNFQKKH